MRRFVHTCAAAAITVMAVACSQTDTGITTNVKTKFATDDLVKAHEINVTTDHGVVTLSGDVETRAMEERAVQIARDTKGVRDVVNNLHVEAAATTGHDTDLGADLKEGAEKTGDALKKAGQKVEDAFTDKNRDSDKDGK